jgi:hypothetical protein
MVILSAFVMVAGTSFCADFVPTGMTYSAVGDFSVNGNPNGVWSYGWARSLGAPIILMTNADTVSADFCGAGWWNGLQEPGVCVVDKNCSDTPYQVGTIIYDPDTLHLDPQSLAVIVRFSVPVSGSYQVSGSLRLQDSLTHAHNLAVVVNTNSTNFFVFTQGGQPGFEYPFDFTCSLEQGQTIDFTASSANGDLYSMGTGLAASVVLVHQLPSGIHTPTTLNVNLTATYQLPNTTNSTGIIVTSVTSSTTLTSASILRLIERSAGTDFPSGSHLAQDGGTAEVINNAGVITNLSSYLVINDTSAPGLVSGITRTDTAKQSGSGLVYTVMSFNDGSGNAFTLDGLVRETISVSARSVGGEQIESGVFSGSVVGYGTIVDSLGRIANAVFSGTISGTGNGPAEH